MGILPINNGGICKNNSMIRDNLDIKEYHKHPGLSRSGIMDLLQCPQLYWHNYLNYEKPIKSDTEALAMGSLVHTLILEPSTFIDRYYIMPDLDRRTKEGKKIYAENCEVIESLKARDINLTIITKDMYDKASEIAASAKNNKVFKNIISMYNGFMEQSIFYKININDKDIVFKSRPDYYNDDFILDVKTARCASFNSFEKAVYNDGLYIQAAMAIDALNSMSDENNYKTFIFLVIEKEPPYLTATYVLDEEVIEYGRKKYMDASLIYLECKEKDEWPSYTNKLDIIGLPKWVKMGEFE